MPCVPPSCPVVTIFGLDFAYLLVGTVFTEKIFGIQGIGPGRSRRRAAHRPADDLGLHVLIGAAFIVVANILVDILYSVIDPRVRLS